MGIALLICAIFAFTLIKLARVRDSTTPAEPAAIDTLEQANRIKWDAEDLKSRGRLIEALDRYKQLQSLCEGSNQPGVRQVAQEARVREAALEQMIAARIANQVPGSVAIAPELSQSLSAGTTTTIGPLTHATPAAIRFVPPDQPATQPAVAIGPSPVYPRKPIRPATAPATELTDEQIGAAIQKGVNFLMAGAHRQGQPLIRTLQQMPGFGAGEDALELYALLQCGEAIDDPRLNPHDKSMDGAIARLKTAQFGHYQTYGRSLRCAALSLYNRPQDRAALKEDVAWLVQAGAGAGTYSYENNGLAWDNSNSQYGLLGVWCGAETGIEVPTAYWGAVEQHWNIGQTSSGQWRYKYGINTDLPRVSMNCAGIASLLITHDYLESPKYVEQVGRDPFTPALRRGLDWLETGDNCIDIQPDSPSPYRNWGYNLYGVERIGLASGFKYFGRHDWYRELAKQVIAAQLADGSWAGDERIDTSYMLLFLARGRHPILMNKLRLASNWANRPRDVANLARFSSHEMERQFNWQVVPLTHDWVDWTDSPILYLASHKSVLSIVDSDVQKIRQFILAGGMLFTQADGDSPEFDAFAHTLARRLFPEYEMTDVPADHAIYSVAEPVRPTIPLKMVSNGSRILMLHSPTDIAKWWQRRDTKTGERYFALGLNMFVYAAGKRDFHNRLASTFVPPVEEPPVQTINIARLQYAGAWDPEPYAWSRFARVFQRRTGYALNVELVALRELRPGIAPLVHLTGAFGYRFTNSEVEAMRAYVASGGILLIDSCGGGGAFEQSVRDDLLPRAFPQVVPRFFAPKDAPFASGAAGMADLSGAQLRRAAIEMLGSHSGNVMVLRYGRGHVVSSGLDITSGLLGTNTWGIIGFAPEYSQALTQNVILWTLDGQRD